MTFPHGCRCRIRIEWEVVSCGFMTNLPSGSSIRRTSKENENSWKRIADGRKKSEGTLGTTYTWIKEYTLMEGVKDGEYLNEKTGQSKVSALGDV